MPRRLRPPVKADASPLTLADLRAHRLIAGGAAGSSRPQIPVLSEEAGGHALQRSAPAGARYWLVDPLDGTKEFLSRNGQFTVNIALIEAHAPVLGVVHVPVHRHQLPGSAGRGRLARARPGERASPIRVSAHERLAAARGRQPLAPRAIRSMRFSRAPGARDWCPWAARSSSAWSPRGPPTCTRVWAPPASGILRPRTRWCSRPAGTVSTLEGAPLRYNTREELLNPFFVVYGPKDRDWLALLR